MTGLYHFYNVLKGYISGCGWHGYNLVTFHFLKGRPNIACSKVCVLLFPCVMCEWQKLQRFKTFSNLFIVAIHDTYQHMLCLVTTVDCTHVVSATRTW